MLVEKERFRLYKKRQIIYDFRWLTKNDRGFQFLMSNIIF